ncbi:Phosphoserine phosphatase [Dispira simplex]|nr:Phosphoserine phosphatase [Dispira simplex]
MDPFVRATDLLARVQFPQEWLTQCVNYSLLDIYIETEVTPKTLHAIGVLSPPENPRTSSSWIDLSKELVANFSNRLVELSKQVPCFGRLVEEEVDHVAVFIAKQLNAMRTAVEALPATPPEQTLSRGKELQGQLDQIRSFAEYNQLLLSHVLEKFDEQSGLRFRHIYLLNAEGGDDFPFAINQIAALENNLTNVVHQKHGEMHVSTAVSKLKEYDQEASLLSLVRTSLPQQKVLISLGGPHGTDIISSVLHCMSRYTCPIEDFMFSRLYHQVTFGVLVTLVPSDMSLYQDLKDAAKEWDANLSFEIFEHRGDSQRSQGEDNNGPLSHMIQSLRQHFRPVVINSSAMAKYPSQKVEANADNPAAVTRWIQEAPYSGRKKYTATVFNQRGLTTEFLYLWTRFLLDHKISVEKMIRLDREPICSAIDYILSVPEDQDITMMRNKLIALSIAHATDVALQPYNVFRRNKRLVVFDMDSTLIQQEVIDEIGRYAGLTEQIAAITERAMNGDIDFKESLRQRVQLLKDTPIDVIDAVKKRLDFTEGARLLCHALKRLGFKLAVISGGFIPFANYVKHELGLDYAFANNLKVSADGTRLIGETTGSVVDAERKAELLEVIAQAESVSLDQVVAVGDGANDLLMLDKAGLGIAFNAKPRVQEQAKARINQKSLKYVLYLLGYNEEECLQLTDANF